MADFAFIWFIICNLLLNNFIRIVFIWSFNSINGKYLRIDISISAHLRQEILFLKCIIFLDLLKLTILEWYCGIFLWSLSIWQINFRVGLFFSFRVVFHKIKNILKILRTLWNNIYIILDFHQFWGLMATLYCF
jgi:hypothetical protein